MVNIAPINGERQQHSPLAFLPVNRNLMHCPIARGDRMKFKWKRNEDEGYRRYRLNDRLSIKLSLFSQIKRHATAFDVAVLLTLTGLAKARSNTLKLSTVEILRHMDAPITSRTRTKVAKSLKFWRHAELVWKSGWYVNRKRIDVKFMPPIARKEGRIEVHDLWLTTADQYFERLPPSLPLDAPTQNLVLVLLSKRLDEGVDGVRVFKSQRQVTRLIGLNDRGDRNRRLEATINRAKRWFAKQGGRLRWHMDENGLEFRFKPPVLRELPR